ncbi:hypothetical protein SS50377_21691 [Spironucleus salmonicida]|uniref:Uncharacterized protein n=1 Tax=Spironucleus salmonicida TaxID=348837 RepID=V6LD24_9EUKA|nr:hypothetical protein SS50377_21691 [Spironucleus salmonicida]|eukprot:EST42362.1 Hypothetical protein SS50377_18093 [Spironucleus salmonicida]
MILQIQIYIKIVKVQLNTSGFNENTTTQWQWNHENELEIEKYNIISFVTLYGVQGYKELDPMLDNIFSFRDLQLPLFISCTCKLAYQYNSALTGEFQSHPVSTYQRKLPAFRFNIFHSILYNHIQSTFTMYQQIQIIIQQIYNIKLKNTKSPHDVAAAKSFRQISQHQLKTPHSSIQTCQPLDSNPPLRSPRFCWASPLSFALKAHPDALQLSCAGSQNEGPYNMVILHPCRYLACFVILCQSQQEMGAFSKFWIRGFQVVILMRCLDALSKLMEIQEFHRSRAARNHKFTGNEDFEAVGFKTYSVDQRKLSLLGIVDVCCWKWNNRIWTFQNSQESCQGAGRMEVNFISCDCAGHTQEDLVHFAQYKNQILLGVLVVFIYYQA